MPKHTEKEMNDAIIEHIKLSFLKTAQSARELARAFRKLRFSYQHQNNLVSYATNNIPRIH